MLSVLARMPPRKITQGVRVFRGPFVLPNLIVHRGEWRHNCRSNWFPDADSPDIIGYLHKFLESSQEMPTAEARRMP